MAKVKIINYTINKIDPNTYVVNVSVRVDPEIISGMLEARISGTLTVVYTSEGLKTYKKTVAVTDFGIYNINIRVRDPRPTGTYRSRIEAILRGTSMIYKGMGVISVYSRDYKTFTIALTKPRAETPYPGPRPVTLKTTPRKVTKPPKYSIPRPPVELKPVRTRHTTGGTIFRRRKSYVF